MWASVLYGINDIRFEEVAEPEPKNDEVLIKIMAAGICGSDVSRVFGTGAYHYPIILGHEFSGINIETGKKAVVFPLIPCNECPMCKIGEYASCRDYDYYGSRRDGGFAQYIAVKRWNVVDAPEDISFEELAMCEPAAVALHAIHLGEISVGDTIMITGAGAIGLILAQWARLNGAKRVLFTDIDKRKLEYAKDMGFSEYNGETVDVSIEGTGASDALECCLSAIKPYGKIVIMGNPHKDISLSQKAYWQILRKQLTLKGTWNSQYNGFRNEWKLVLEAISSKRLNLTPLITHRFPLSESKKAFSIIKERHELVNKIVFTGEF